MEFETALNEIQGAVEDRLRQHLDAMVEAGRGYHPTIEDAYGTLREFILRRGRRIASSATLMTYHGYGGDFDDTILDICAAIEMYRHAILIHDDLVDEDRWRRGGETVHLSLAGGVDGRYGRGAALFIGNGLMARAFQTVISSGLNAEKTTMVMDLLSSDFLRVNESQVLDLLFEYKVPDEEEWRIMASRRAASLFEANLLIGAVLADAPAEDLRLLREAGRNIGYAFDIQDDIIDLMAPEDEYGRPTGGDLLRGKKPLHVVIGLRREPKLVAMLERVTETGDPEVVGEMRESLLRSGAIGEARKACIDHAGNASSCIMDTSMSEESKQFFDGLLGLISESLDWYTE